MISQKKMLFLPFLFLLHTSCATAKCNKEHSEDEQPIFSTKTAYDWLPAKNNFFSNPPKLHSNIQYGNQNCSAMHVYNILRHGARNPGLRDTLHMADIQKKLSKIKHFNSVTEPLKFWKSPFVESGEGQLIKLGEIEHMSIAHRFMDAFNNVFVKNRRLQSLRFVSSTKHRCVDSMKAFGDGVKDYLRTHKLNVDDFHEQVTRSYNNTLLRFYDYCGKYQKDVKKNKQAMADYYKFLKGDHIGKVVHEVNKKFQVKDSFFDSGDVRVMYILCAFEQCLLNHSDWCRILDHDERIIFEYLSDIKQYWINAYGHKVNYQQSCPIVKDLLHSIISSVQAHRRGENYTKGNFMFGHGETLAPVYSSLGLFKDTLPLKADNFKEQRHRRFHSSYILPFAANIAFVTYHCLPQEGIYIQRNDNEVFMEKATEYVVQIYLNERLIDIPECGSTCPIRHFEEKYQKIESCKFNKICHLNKTD